jgi:hypothetical protein
MDGWMEEIKPRMAVALESKIRYWSPPGREQKFRFHILYEEKAAARGSASPWTRDVVEIEIIGSGTLTRCEDKTKWQRFWKGRAFANWF